METTVQNEITFYRDVNIMVTQSRFVANSKTYAMRNISSVHILEIIKSRKLPVMAIIIGLLVLFFTEAKIAGFFILAFGTLLLCFIKNEFAVRISTNSGEANSVVSKDKMYVQRIVIALNEAMVHRG